MAPTSPAAGDGPRGAHVRASAHQRRGPSRRHVERPADSPERPLRRGAGRPRLDARSVWRRGRDGRLYGRGSCDMKAGIAAAVFAAEAIRRAGVSCSGADRDERHGGRGERRLRRRRLARRAEAALARADQGVIIPEPFGVDRVCIGHRGVYWFEVPRGAASRTAACRISASTPSTACRTCSIGSRRTAAGAHRRVTAMPVVPRGLAARDDQHQRHRRRPAGGRGASPCVADRCRVVFDRRFLLEEGLGNARRDRGAAAQGAGAHAGREVLDRRSVDLRADAGARGRAIDWRADRGDRTGDRARGWRWWPVRAR